MNGLLETTEASRKRAFAALKEHGYRIAVTDMDDDGAGVMIEIFSPGDQDWFAGDGNDLLHAWSCMLAHGLQERMEPFMLLQCLNGGAR